MLRLGDGQIHAMKADGTFYPPLKGKLVSSMYSPDAAQNMETAFYPEPAAAVMMFSDGFYSREEHPTELVRQLVDYQAAAISEDALRAGDCGDDQTVIVAMDEKVVASGSFRNGLMNHLWSAANMNELCCYRATVDGLARKLVAIGPQAKEWDRVLAQIMEQGGTYFALLEGRNNLMEGDV